MHGESKSQSVHAVRPLRAGLCLLASFMLSACGGTDGDSATGGRSWSTSSTTVGDTVVARTTGAIPVTGTHQLTEVWRVGDPDAIDSTITFGQVDAFAVNRANTVAVFDASGPTLRLYDASGSYLRTIGRKGAGPGEYSSANGLAFLDDGRLALWDAPTSRITLFRETGEIDREWKPPVSGWRLRDGLSSTTRHPLVIRAMISDTSLRDSNGFPRLSAAYFLYDSSGRVVDTLMPPSPSREPAVMEARSEGRIARLGVPFSPGQAHTLLGNNTLATGEGDRYRIDVIGGASPLRIERDAVAATVADAEREEQRALVERQMSEIEPNWRWSGPQIPSNKPLFLSLAGDADARLWVRLSAPGEQIPEAERDTPRPSSPDEPAPIVRTMREPVWYDVFAADGTMLGRVVMPPRATWLGARGDLVWGVVRDELDVPSLVQWRITPAWDGK